MNYNPHALCCPHVWRQFNNKKEAGQLTSTVVSTVVCLFGQWLHLLPTAPSRSIYIMTKNRASVRSIPLSSGEYWDVLWAATNWNVLLLTCHLLPLLYMNSKPAPCTAHSCGINSTTKKEACWLTVQWWVFQFFICQTLFENSPTVELKLPAPHLQPWNTIPTPKVLQSHNSIKECFLFRLIPFWPWWICFIC